MTLLALPAFTDNYIWMIHDGRQALVVDPGEASPVLQALDRLDLDLCGILVTHHHRDHVGGLTELALSPRARGARWLGPDTPALPVPVDAVHEGDRLTLGPWSIDVLEVPGHTRSHRAFVVRPICENHGMAPLLFCGDALFSAGCGRLFEGTPAQMLQSLRRLAALPAETQVCCAHEYTLANLRFARAVEPDNLAVIRHEAQCTRLRERDLPTLPTTIGLEREINPFLRCEQSGVIDQAVARGASADDPVSVFAAIRQWKDNYR
ncbi:MAG: hydroxyacylglutathione hydrolase [Pseudomonadota bacterium]|jgi:hydroxyacylglutathione hydrolase